MLDYEFVFMCVVLKFIEKYDHIYLYVSMVKECFILFTIGDYVRLWLCPYVFSIRVDLLFFLLGYVSLMMVILMILNVRTPNELVCRDAYMFVLRL